VWWRLWSPHRELCRQAGDGNEAIGLQVAREHEFRGFLRAGVWRELAVDEFHVFAADDVVVDGKLVLDPSGFLLFRVRRAGCLLALFGLAKLQIPSLRAPATSCGLSDCASGNQDADFLPGGYIFHREGVVEGEVAFFLSLAVSDTARWQKL